MADMWPECGPASIPERLPGPGCRFPFTRLAGLSPWERAKGIEPS